MTFDRVVAGHRVLRLLADGERSQVWLAAGDIVLKVLTPPVSVGAVGNEVEALHRACGEHVVELLDLSVDGGVSVLIFPRLPRGSLADLLRRRTALDAGEAVTLLAPIASGLIRLHAAGVAHGRMTADAVLFSSDGAPMLTGFGAAHLFDPGLPEIELEKLDGVAADRAALLALAEAVLARTTGDRGKVAVRFGEALRETPPGELAERMVRELFELAAARPVAFERDVTEPDGPAGRVVAVAEVAVVEAESPTSGVKAWAERMIETGPGSLVREAVRDRWAGWSVTRRRMVLAAAAAGLAVVVAIAVVPPASPSGPQPAPTAAVDDGAPDPSADSVTQEDPIEALAQLADRRDTCFHDLSVLCLDGVDETGSSAFEADRAVLQAILDGGDAPRPLPLGSITLTERLGDSALLDLGPHSDPASVLLLKGEAGWRIRDYLAPLGAGESDGS